MHSQELLEELNNLRSRAKKVDYKNQMPKLPAQKLGRKIDHLMVGFSMRLDNWKRGLSQLENPGGVTYIQSEENKSSGNFVIKNPDFGSLSDNFAAEDL